MIEKECAIDIHTHALKAITALTLALNQSQNRCSPERFEQIKRGIGIAIGEIQMEVLEPLYVDFPELDDLK